MQIPGYQLEQELGVGGMATVFVAVQESLHRKVALKVMTPGLAVDETYCHRFLKEGRILAQLNHPNLLTVYDIGVHQDHYYMAMELLPGGTVRDRINADRGAEGAAKIVADIARGLHYAHSKGFVHRDVKPGNLLFRADGDCVLGDFGIAKAVDSNTGATKLGTSIGTPHYMSPEQAKGEKVDHRTDLYSLGVVFFEMLTGKPPFDADDPFSVALMQINEPVPKLPAAHQRYQGLIEKLMSKDRQARYANAEEFVSALEGKFKPGHGAAKAPPPSPPRQPKARVARPPSATDKSLPSGPARRPWRTIGWGGSLGLLALAAIYLWRYGLPWPTDVIDQEDGSGQIQLVERSTEAQSRQDFSKQLAEAQIHIAAGRYLDPPQRSALGIYEKLLVNDPNNDQVRLALRELANIIEASAEETWARGRPRVAHQLLQRALQVFPQDQGLRYLNETIEEQHGASLGLTTPTEPVDGGQDNSSVKQAQIDELLAQGDRYFEQNRFSHPPGKNAMDVYKQVLALDPNHARANSQLQALADIWADVAQAQLERGNHSTALGMVERGLLARPEHPRLQAIKQELVGAAE